MRSASGRSASSGANSSTERENGGGVRAVFVGGEQLAGARSWNGRALLDWLSHPTAHLSEDIDANITWD